jgi:hypothetical protein
MRQSKNAWQRHLFAVRFSTMHGKGDKKIVFPLGANGGYGRWKIFLPCAIEKTHGKLKGLPCVSKKTHGKLFFTVRFLFAVRPI